MIINLVLDPTTAALFPGGLNSLPATWLNPLLQAKTILQNTLTDNITVNIRVGYGEITFDNVSLTVSSGGEGGPEFGPVVNYSNLIADLKAHDPTNTVDMAAYNSLPATAPAGHAQIEVSRPEAKALGLLAADTTVDGDVGFATIQNLPGQTLSVGLALHELTHALGRTAYQATGFTYNGSPIIGIEDLFRFSSQGTYQFNNTSGAYLSYDFGKTDLANFDFGTGNHDPGDFVGITPDDPFNENVGLSNNLSHFDINLMGVIGYKVTTSAPSPNPAPPSGTTADMILRHGADGKYEIYDIGANNLLAAYQLGQVGTDWRFVGLGGFNGTDTTDMLLRSASTGGFEVYDITNNNITNAAFLGAVGMNWQVMGFGNFSSMPGESDMILRNSNTGGVEVYDITNNQITGAAFMGAVGLNWQFSGVGNFSSRGESDMILRNSNTGGLEVYDIANNQLTGAAFIGTVGLEWQFSGVGNFSSVPGESDLLLRNVNTGGLEVYNINNSQLTGAAFIGAVGLEWQFAGIAAANGAGTSDLVLRNVNSGAFEVYDIAHNQLTGAASLGAVGLDWQMGGFAADPPTGSMGSSGSTSQLVQAMAGFGGGSGAADGLNTAPLSAETSQQPLLTTPQHA
jgi:hypothetical protein